jgi:hypothetical protein
MEEVITGGDRLADPFQVMRARRNGSALSRPRGKATCCLVTFEIFFAAKSRAGQGIALSRAARKSHLLACVGTDGGRTFGAP